MLKSQKGVTFLICIITIIVLLIIGGAVANAGITTYRNSKVKAFVTEMKMIQEKINLYNDRAKLDPLKDVTALGCSVEDETQATYQGVQNWLNAHADLIAEEDYQYLRYIDGSTESAELGLKEIDRAVLYNYKTKKLYSMEPAMLYRSDGEPVECYTLDQVTGGYE